MTGLFLAAGMASVDYVALVDAFPVPDEKVRTENVQVLGGGNCGNALTCAARLGLKPRIITKVAEDANGRSILAGFDGDGVDTSYVAITKEGTSMFSFVIVDQQTKTRTCIYQPTLPTMVPDDLPRSRLSSAMDGARFVYLDCSLHEIDLLVAQEAARMNIPIVIDAERKTPVFNDLLHLASYVVCAENFPQFWTSAPSITSALMSLLLQFPRTKFVIVTLGCNGCIMLERSCLGEDPKMEAVDVDSLIESLKLRIDKSNTAPLCISSPIMRLSADGIGTVNGRLLLGTAESIPPSELVDTTGAGDAFVGAVLYALCAGMPPEKMLPFAAQVAAAGCRAMGARPGLPRRTDPRLAPFLY
ncbi:Ribokinase/fructokinase protein [Dioscorea alata]|uniref:Ribokinase/fructokinase protein n=1 Tax=Dioscorea alata TaxID=55571 RepID=A0ACB7WRY2_DIOAL|nr:Ribokinase/fructokinase protein [Dioscorea alata]